MDNSHRALSSQGDHKGDHKLLLWPDLHPGTKSKEVSTSAQTNQGTSHPKEKSVLTRRPAWYPNKKSWISKKAVLLNSDPSPNLQTQKLLIRKPLGYTSEQAASVIQHPFPGVVTYCYRKKCCHYELFLWELKIQYWVQSSTKHKEDSRFSWVKWSSRAQLYWPRVWTRACTINLIHHGRARTTVQKFPRNQRRGRCIF